MSTSHFNLKRSQQWISVLALCSMLWMSACGQLPPIEPLPVTQTGNGSNNQTGLELSDGAREESCVGRGGDADGDGVCDDCNSNPSALCFKSCEQDPEGYDCAVDTAEEKKGISQAAKTALFTIGGLILGAGGAYAYLRNLDGDLSNQPFLSRLQTKGGGELEMFVGKIDRNEVETKFTLEGFNGQKWLAISGTVETKADDENSNSKNAVTRIGKTYFGNTLKYCIRSAYDAVDQVDLNGGPPTVSLRLTTEYRPTTGILVESGVNNLCDFLSQNGNRLTPNNMGYFVAIETLEIKKQTDNGATEFVVHREGKKPKTVYGEPTGQYWVMSMDPKAIGYAPIVMSPEALKNAESFQGVTQTVVATSEDFNRIAIAASKAAATAALDQTASSYALKERSFDLTEEEIGAMAAAALLLDDAIITRTAAFQGSK